MLQKSDLNNFTIIHISIPFSLFLFGCNSKIPNTINNNLKIIDMKKAITNTKQMKLSEIAQNIDYICLETSSECLIGKVAELKIKDNRIYINELFSKSLLEFDINGDFSKTIGANDKGPRKFSHILDYILTDNNTVIIFNPDNQEILEYSNNGNLIENINMKFSTYGLEYFSENIYCISNPRPTFTLSDYFRLTFINNKGKIINKLLPQSPVGINPKDRLPLYKLYRFCDTLSYWDSYCDTIFRINTEFNIIPRYKFDFGTLKFPNELYKKNPPLHVAIKYMHISGYVETADYLFISGRNKQNKLLTVYNKNTGNIFGVCSSDGTSFKGIKNDIDGFGYFWPDGMINPNKIYKIVDVIQIKQIISKNKDLNESITKGLDKQLINIVENKNIYDNPILMVVTLK